MKCGERKSRRDEEMRGEGRLKKSKGRNMGNNIKRWRKGNKIR